MCGRYALHDHPSVVALQFGLSAVPQFSARYNIAPTAEVLLVKSGGASLARWGLVPGWARDSSIGAKLCNARSETVGEKPAFREAYRKRRCLVPASGYYEWKALGGPKQGRKQPYYIRPADAPLFAFAGLWETWNELETCAIVTTDANDDLRAIHDRMPLLLGRDQWAAWLAGDEGLVNTVPTVPLRTHPVSVAVNRAANDAPQLIEPIPLEEAETPPPGTTRGLFDD
jgi:putative SOS response-associated peptidase YedK